MGGFLPSFSTSSLCFPLPHCLFRYILRDALYNALFNFISRLIIDKNKTEQEVNLTMALKREKTHRKTESKGQDVKIENARKH